VAGGGHSWPPLLCNVRVIQEPLSNRAPLAARAFSAAALLHDVCPSRQSEIIGLDIHEIVTVGGLLASGVGAGIGLIVDRYVSTNVVATGDRQAPGGNNGNRSRQSHSSGHQMLPVLWRPHRRRPQPTAPGAPQLDRLLYAFVSPVTPGNGEIGLGDAVPA